MLFADIIGQASTKNVLINSVKNKQVAHAQLFLGRDGSANLSLALAYAQYVNCEDPQENDSCGNCTSCIQYKKIVHPDLHTVFPMASLEKVDKEHLKSHLLKLFREFVLSQPYGGLHEWGEFVGAENKQFNIPVDEGRGIIQNISLKSYQSEYKIVLIWMPELMNTATANAILKVLEEPPAKTLFLLVANDYEKLLATILSRCQMIYVPSFSEEETKEYLIKTLNRDEKTAAKIAKIAEGNLNKAKVLAEAEEDNNHRIFAEWMRFCFGRKFAELVPFCDELSKKGRENQKNLLQYSLQVVRDALMNKSDIPELIMQNDDELKFVVNFSKALNETSINKLYEILNETFHHIERNGNPKIVFFDTSIKIMQVFQR